MGIIDNVKEIADLIKKLNDVDLYRKIVGLEGEILDLTRQNRQFQQEVEELQATVDIQHKLEFRAPFYWVEGDKTPYCAKCWESQKKAIHMFFVGVDDASNVFRCSLCEFTASP